MSSTIHFRKVRRDAKLLHLPADKRALIDKWLAEEGPAACSQRIEKELGISTSPTSIYRAIARWDADARFALFNGLAEAQVEMLETKIEEARKDTENKTLSAEERARRVREILGA